MLQRTFVGESTNYFASLKSCGVYGVTSVNFPTNRKEFKGLPYPGSHAYAYKKMCPLVSSVSPVTFFALSEGTPMTPCDTICDFSLDAKTMSWKRKKIIGLQLGLTPVTPMTPSIQAEDQHFLQLKTSIDLFRLDLVVGEIANGVDGGELARINNLTWEFMRFDNLSFDNAMQLAAEIVLVSEMSPCERNYIDVLEFYLLYCRKKIVLQDLENSVQWSVDLLQPITES